LEKNNQVRKTGRDSADSSTSKPAGNPNEPSTNASSQSSWVARTVLSCRVAIHADLLEPLQNHPGLPRGPAADPREEERHFHSSAKVMHRQ
jgi:hypothetical protein